MKKTKIHLHSDGKTLWPSSVSEVEARMIETLTPPQVFQAIYQGAANIISGNLFQSEWLDRQTMEVDDDERNRLYAIAQSWDCANTANERNAASAGVCLGIRQDYSMVVLDWKKGYWEFPQLISQITDFASKWHDGSGKFHSLLIESKVSGQSAAQYLMQNGPTYFRPRIVAITPTADKDTRAGIAAMWTKNGMVYFDKNMVDFEQFKKEILGFPNNRSKDVMDSFSQTINWFENYLKQGFELRMDNGIYGMDYDGVKITLKEKLLRQVRAGRR